MCSLEYYDKITITFNDHLFIPQTIVLPDLYDDFTLSRDLKINRYELTKDKAKDILVSIWPNLAIHIANYELNGAGQMRLKLADDYGHFDLDRCINGDDRKFSHAMRMSHIYYIGDTD